jgi:hypothetical protein
MSEVKSFVSASINDAPRGTNYLVSPTQKKSPTRWPVGSPAPASANSEFHLTSKAAGFGPFADQIRTVLKSHYRFHGEMPRRSLVDQQVKLLCSHYKDLKKLGFDIHDVTSFSLKHAKALLSKWQAGGCTNNTVYCRWSVLRSWTRALNKHGMLPSLSELQPGFARYANFKKSIRRLTPAQIEQRSQFLRAQSDLTVYLGDRLCRELNCTREGVFQIDLDAVLAVVEGDATALRAGVGNQRTHITHVRLILHC